jgi:tRNA(Arg) A34 adenosine deaminase TadA
MNPMHRAIDLSQMGLRHGGPFGAVVTRGTEIIGEGFNLVVLHKDPTAHAEIIAIRDACRFLKTYNLTGCVLHTSCEPCLMCWGAIHWARINRVCYAANRDDATNAGFDDNEFHRQLALPIPERSIEFVQALESERVAARAILDAWRTLPEKHSY